MYAVLPAAGTGSRMGSLVSGTSKILLPISGEQTALGLALEVIVQSEVCKGIVISLRDEDRPAIEQFLAGRFADSMEIVLVRGGETRQESVFNALERLKGRCEFVLVHDAARPLCRPELIRRVAEKGRETGAAIVAVPVSSTLKESPDGQTVTKTMSRVAVWKAQTPQVFGYQLLYEAHKQAREEGFIGTDDSELVERTGQEVAIVEGLKSNLKITTPEDLELARVILEGMN